MGTVQVTLSASTGALTLGGIAGLSFTTGDGTSDARMQFTGTVAAVNTALDGLTFTPPANYNGAAGIGLVVDDQGNTGSGGALSDTQAIAVTINAVNDAPSISVADDSNDAVRNDARLLIWRTATPIQLDDHRCGKRPTRIDVGGVERHLDACATHRD